MLYYKPPFLMVDNVTVFPDHVDPQAFYYIVSVPELVKQDGQPSFWAVAILPEVAVVNAGAAGAAATDISRVNISFDVQLAATAAQLETVKKEIQKQRGVEAKRLTPAPLESGKTTLIVAHPGAEANKDLVVYDGHPPSLVDENRAAFAVSAQADEAKMLVASLAAGSLAAVVGYELKFLGLTPSFQARMVVHWQSVYEQFRKRDTTNFIFSSEEVDQTVEHLVESRSIQIDVKELDPAGASSATKALFDELKSEVVKKLFETPRPVGDVPIEDRIGRGVRDVLTSILPGVSHTLRQMQQTELSDTVVDLNDQQVHAYPYYPQSTLAGMAARAGGIAGQLKMIDLGTLPLRVEEVPVEMAAGAAALGVKVAIVRVQALTADRQTTLVDQSIEIAAAAPERSVVRFRRRDSGEPVIRYTVDMVLDPATAPDGRERWTFDWREAHGQRIYFDPGEWLDTRTIRFEMESATVFDLPASVMLDVEAWLADGSSPFRTAHYDFSKTAMSQATSVIVPEGKQVTFKGSETFRRPGEPDLVRARVFTPPVYTIRNPFSQAWSMEIHAAADWTATDSLFGEMRVWDVARQLWLTAETKFTGSAPVYVLRFAASPETPRHAEIRLTRIAKSGEIVRGPWTDLAGAVVGINDKVEAIRRIRVILHAPTFTDDRVQRVSVDLQYQAGDVDASGTVTLTADGASADWRHPFPDFSQPGFRHRVKARSVDGDAYAEPWKTSASDDLTVELPSSPWQ